MDFDNQKGYLNLLKDLNITDEELDINKQEGVVEESLQDSTTNSLRKLSETLKKSNSKFNKE